MSISFWFVTVATLSLGLNTARQVKDIPDPVITVVHWGCMIPCPVYTLNIFEDGHIVFIGHPTALFDDTEYGQMSSDTVHALISEAVAGGFFYADGNCFYPADVSVPSMTIRQDSMCRTLSCGFTSLLEHVERASHVIRWVGTSHDRGKSELNYSAKFPGRDSLMGGDWERQLTIFDQPRRDSVDKALKKFYHSLTDEQADSLWKIENK